MARTGLALMMLASVGASHAIAREPLQPLPEWMAGTWVSQESDGGWAEEWWSSPRAGLMLGGGRTGKADVLEFWEQARIERSDKGLRFCASPLGRAPATCFQAISAGASEIVFENPAHDYPVRISYRREGNELVATTTGPNGSKPQSWRYRKSD